MIIFKDRNIKNLNIILKQEIIMNRLGKILQMNKNQKNFFKSIKSKTKKL